MKQISMLELKKHVDALGKDELILDLRTPEEFAEGHIPGAKNIPHDQVTTPAALAEIKKYKTVYLHCRSGGRVGIATQMLAATGLTHFVCIVGSGMPDWQAAGYPVKTGSP
jgi:rhodanese-related sulfurtransferase